MIQPAHYKLTCDEPGCPMHERHDNPFELRRIGERLGWTFNRRRDGTQASRGGKDYCPRHQRKDPTNVR